MKILRLDLRAYGPFADVALDLSAGTEGLHLVYGPNEAGKSSALRAIRAMLYGIPVQTPDNFRFDYNKLAVGGTLRAADGRELGFLRVKRQNRTLRGLDGQTELEEAALDPFLQGVGEPQFRTLFGLDHAELIEGGKSVLEGKNDLGQLLFAAGTGLAAARKVQESIQAELDALFKPTGKNPPINRAIAEYQAARKAAAEAMLPSATWDEHDRNLRQARVRQAELDEALAAARREQARLERIGQAAPALARLRHKREELAALGAVPHLAEDFARRWQEAETGLELARRALAAAEAEAGAIAAERAGVAVPQDVLRLADAIDPLRDALARYGADRQNRPARIAARDRSTHEAARLLADLGLDPEDPPRPTRARRDAIRALAQSLPAARAEAARAAAEVERLDADRRRLAVALESLPAASDPGALALALDRARGAGDLDARIDALAAQIDQDAEGIARDAARLGLWAGPPEALDALPLPTLAAIDADEGTLRDLEAAATAAARAAEAARRDADDAAEAIRRLRLAGAVPTEADLAAARDERDALWARLRRHWLDGERVPSPADLVGDYARAVLRADELADRLRREADRVAALVQAESRRDGAERQATALDAEAERARGRHQAAWTAWLARWEPAGITPEPPRAMREWLTQRVEPLRARLAAAAQARAEFDAATRRRDALRADLVAALAALDEPAPPIADGPLAAMLDAAGAALARRRDLAQRRDATERERLRLDADRATALESREAARRALDAAEARWADAVAPIGLEAGATPEQAVAAVESLAEAHRLRDESRAIDAELAEMDRATSGFVGRVAALAARVDPAIAEPDPEAAAAALLARLDEARAIAEAAARLDERLARALATADRQREAAARHEVARAALAREAGCDTPDAVPAVLEALRQATPLRAEIATIEHNLLQAGRGATLDQIAAEVATVPPDELDGLLARVEAEIVELEARAAEQHRIIGAEGHALAAMDGRDDAAEAAAQASALAAQLATQVDQYVRLRLAGALLRQGIERHRKRNQGPILGRAGRLFERLTLGSFAGLQVDEGPKGEPVLVGLRPGGATVPVTGLSDGTTDALYLALRLAGLEAYLDAHPAMPLVVDDILIQFDDDRAAAALEALAALSRRTQVLLFTHHRRLVELASALPPSVRFVHELPGPAA